LAKSLFLTHERKLSRKIKEAILAFRLEEELTKGRILELYLNQVYFGSGAYGIEAAAQRYFSKSAADLELHEAALLAGLPKAPSRFSPLVNPDLAMQRRNSVLQRMVEARFVSREQADEARRHGLELKPDTGTPVQAPYFVENLRQQLEREFGHDTLYRSGWDVYTTLDVDYQKAAEAAVLSGLFEIEKRRREWRGPVDDPPDKTPPEPGFPAVAEVTDVGDRALTLNCGGIQTSLDFRDIWIKNRDLTELSPATG
nr:transglycosylase domain-containing protein [bacterium]